MKQHLRIHSGLTFLNYCFPPSESNKSLPFLQKRVAIAIKRSFSQYYKPRVGEPIFSITFRTLTNRFLSLCMFELGDLHMLDLSMNLPMTWFCYHGHQLSDESCWRQNNSRGISIKFQDGMTVTFCEHTLRGFFLISLPQGFLPLICWQYGGHIKCK